MNFNALAQSTYTLSYRPPENCHSSTNDVNTTNVHVSTGSTPVSTASTNNSTACLSDATIYAYLATQPNGSQVVHEDLEQIHEDDLDEMDLKWQLALLSMKARKFYQRTGKKIIINGSDTAVMTEKGEMFSIVISWEHFAREVRKPRSQRQDRKSKIVKKKLMNVEESFSKAMIAVLIKEMPHIMTRSLMLLRKGKRMTSAVGEQEINAIKPTTYWGWRPKIKMINQVYKNMDHVFLVQERFKDHPLEGHDLDLWGDLRMIFDLNEEDDIWLNQQYWELLRWKLHEYSGVHSLFLDGTSIQINMLVEKTYPLKKEILVKMINLKIKAEEESTMARELIKFIKSQIAEQS
ncbi:hypothetical protein Tco_0304098 [Tanacetum coccineum]